MSVNCGKHSPSVGWEALPLQGLATTGWRVIPFHPACAVSSLGRRVSSRSGVQVEVKLVKRYCELNGLIAAASALTVMGYEID